MSGLIRFIEHRRWVFLIAIVLILVVLWMLFPRVERPYSAPGYQRWQIADGRFEVVIRATGSLSFAMPGQSGDRSGEVTIYALPSQKSCGTAPVDMVGNVTLDQELDDPKIVTLSRPRRALWDLEACTIRFHDLYP